MLEKPTGADLCISITDSGYGGFSDAATGHFWNYHQQRYANGPVLVERKTVSPFTGEFQI
ncbi:hypothetical protein FHS76_002933 [Ochrobactrum daejeonense]|uniref:Uncharacterized protein n=1 Tax=Brucella daejeonensis TaxID=659015 RepID=A0A7W9AZ06_9HYPH|nr:hypothetical protein [Brucella daejeonensis]MBB5703042.1 hypothetical protein [Brucella daejeonensis]